MKAILTFSPLADVAENEGQILVKLPRTVVPKTLKDVDPPVTFNAVKKIFGELIELLKNYEDVEIPIEVSEFFWRYGCNFPAKNEVKNVKKSQKRLLRLREMPYKPPKPCAKQGCPKLTRSRFCEEHTKSENKIYEKYKRSYKTTERYSASWRKISQNFLSKNPLCEICKENGRLNPAQLVHHILPIEDGGTHDVDNLKSLCKSCHSRLHMKNGNNF